MPSYALFGVALILVGFRPNVHDDREHLVQLATDPAMRGRVMAILLGLALGGTPLGAPIVGRVADRFGPRWALAVGASAGISAACVGLYYLAKHRNLRVHFDTGRPRFAIDVADCSPNPETRNLTFGEDRRRLSRRESPGIWDPCEERREAIDSSATRAVGNVHVSECSAGSLASESRHVSPRRSRTPRPAAAGR